MLFRSIAGGGDGARNVFSFCQSGQWSRPPMASKMVGISLQQGDRIRLETPGGGGWGDLRERDSQALQRDREQGYVRDAGVGS